MSQSSFQITAALTGKGSERDLGVWDTRAGGETESEIAAKRTGEGIKLNAGRATTSDVTISRGFERARDHELLRYLRSVAGRAPMSVTEQPLDDDGNVWGRPTVWTGRLKSVDGGEVDADSDEDRVITLTLAVEKDS